jgi:uncharacterized OsmC-like protein
MAGNKSWTIRAVSNEGADLAFYRQDEALFAGGVPAAVISPVEHLLIGAAGCLVLSCRAVLATGRASQSTVEVTAVGSKAAEPLSRLGRIDIAVRFGRKIDAVEARSVLEKAEKLCTVTNTLRSSVAIAIQPAER